MYKWECCDISIDFDKKLNKEFILSALEEIWYSDRIFKIIEGKHGMNVLFIKNWINTEDKKKLEIHNFNFYQFKEEQDNQIWSKQEIIKSVDQLEKILKRYNTIYLLIDKNESMQVWNDELTLLINELKTKKIFKNIVIINDNELINDTDKSILFTISDYKSEAFLKNTVINSNNLPTIMFNMLPYRLYRSSSLKKASITNLEKDSNWVVKSSYLDSLLERHNLDLEKYCRIPMIWLSSSEVNMLNKFLLWNSKINWIHVNIDNLKDENTSNIEQKNDFFTEDIVSKFFSNTNTNTKVFSFYISALVKYKNLSLTFEKLKIIKDTFMPNSTNIILSEFLNWGLLDKNTDNTYNFKIDWNWYSVQNELEKYYNKDVILKMIDKYHILDNITL